MDDLSGLEVSRSTVSGHVPLLETVSLSNHSLSWHKMVELSGIFGNTSPRYLWLGFECEKVAHD
jgi:hypothetical protein